MFASIERPPPSTSCWNVSVLGVCNFGCNFCELFFHDFFCQGYFVSSAEEKEGGGDAGGPDFVCCKLRERKKKSRKDHSKGPQESC